MSDAIQLPSDREDLVKRLRLAAKEIARAGNYRWADLIAEAADALSEKALPEVTTNDQQQPEK